LSSKNAPGECANTQQGANPEVPIGELQWLRIRI
jgi:hypothetical protein